MNTKITLTNPTDEEINRAVAIYVAGWSVSRPDGYKSDLWENAKGSLEIDGPWFAYSADAVLPLLEKWHDADGQTRDLRICRRLAEDWLVILRTRKNAWDEWTDTFEESGPLPRAACIALLRANGVEVIT